jgi:hypothetical protein
MPQSARGWVLAVAVAWGSAAPAAQAAGRLVRLEVFPTKEAKPVAVNVRENETVITTIKELGTLAFEVRFRDKQEKVVLAVVFDAETKPHVLLGALELPLDGKRVESSTTPPFGIRVRRVESAR